MDDLPFVDEHARVVAASPARTWSALVAVVESIGADAGRGGFARLLGCEPATSAGPRPLAEGATIPGFRVDEAAAPERLALTGRHRFSRYALVFVLEPLGAGCRVRAQTWAAFPGVAGRAYRLAVIGTRGHVLAVRRMLAAVAGRAAAPDQR